LPPTAQYAIPTRVYAIFQPYESGDYDAVARAFPSRREYLALAQDLTRTRLTWRKNWRRVHAVFLLEIALVGFRQSWTDRAEVLRDAQAFLMLRPGAPGEFREEDAFEVLWHRAALGILQGSLDGGMMDQYLTQLSDRLGPTPAPAGLPPRLVDERLALTRAMAAELTLLPGIIRMQTAQIGRGLTQVYQAGATPLQSATALARLDEAAAFEINREEAVVRRANVLVRTNRADAAVAALDQLRGPSRDVRVQYWRDLLRGRALDILDRLDDAAQAYGEAHTLVPSAQSPLLALSVLRFRQGKFADAQQLTRQVHDVPVTAKDPWSLYWHGDARFVNDLLKVLRELAK
jgi:tetratricopeptide (TPR) repeat protein